MKNDSLLNVSNDYTCLTTDKFITDVREVGKLVFDMEAYADAEVAENFDFKDKFYSLKFISDIVGQNSLEKWEKDVNELKKRLTDKIIEIANSK